MPACTRSRLTAHCSGLAINSEAENGDDRMPRRHGFATVASIAAVGLIAAAPFPVSSETVNKPNPPVAKKLVAAPTKSPTAPKPPIIQGVNPRTAVTGARPIQEGVLSGSPRNQGNSPGRPGTFHTDSGGSLAVPDNRAGVQQRSTQEANHGVGTRQSGIERRYAPGDRFAGQNRLHVRVADIPFSNNMSPDDLRGSMEKLNISFLASMREMLIAQSYTILALGDRSKSDELNTVVDALEGKSDIDTVSRTITISQSASDEINQKMADAIVVDADGRAAIARAVPHYSEGMLDATQLPKAYKDALSATINSAKGGGGNPLGMFAKGGTLSQAANLVSITTHIPNLISAWGQTTANFQKFANSNSVDTSDLSSKI